MDFAVSDSDLVFKRNPARYIIAGVLAFETVLFGVIGTFVLLTEREKMAPVAIIMGLALATLAVVTIWLWSYEARITPYDFVVRSAFGTRVVPLSSITGLKRTRVKGNNPPQYNLEVTTADGLSFKVADMKKDDAWLHERLRERCRSVITEFAD